MPRRTALVVAVPEAEAFHASDVGIPTHVTILFPFLDLADVDEGELRALFARFAPFDYALDRLERWPHAAVLLPSPPEPFVDLTHAVWERWPDHPPYEGVHDTVIPHVTLTVDDAPLTLRGRATEVLLIEEEEPGGMWTEKLRFALGSYGVA